MITSDLEEGNISALDFKKIQRVIKNGIDVIPVAVQDYVSREVLMVAYSNAISLKYTLDSGYATFWSTSKNALHTKGETSGDRLKIMDIRVNCEQNSLLFLVELEGNGACHTKSPNQDVHRFGCFYRRMEGSKLKHI